MRYNTELKPCYIAKGQGYFAHGETIRKACNALEEKILCDLDVDTVVEEFNKTFTNREKKYPVLDFYRWHHMLTGSCEFGRKEFAKKHGIDIEHDKMTVDEFIELTKNSYGGDVIKRLEE